MLSEIVKKIKEKRVDEFEVYLVISLNTKVEIKEQKVDYFEASQAKGACIRLLKNQRLGFSYCTNLSPKSIKLMIEDALSGAINSAPDLCYSFPERRKEEDFPFQIFDPDLDSISEEEKIEKARSLEKAAFSYDRRIKKVRKASYHESITTVSLFNSKGIDSSYQKSLVTSSIMVVAEEDSEAEMGYDFDFTHFFKELDPEKVGIRAAERAVKSLGAKRIGSLKTPVILDSLVASEFLSILAISFLAESVRKNKSLLKNKLNLSVFSPCLDIIDDGLYPGGISTAPFDGEGVKKGKTILAEGGVLKNYLYDTYWANKDKTLSTGNSQRGSLKMPPEIGISNLFIPRGSLSLDELVAGIERGMLITEVMGAHTANPISGDFSVGVAGFWIEGGKIRFPVRGIALNDNLLELFNKVDSIGNDLRFWGKVGSPSLRIKQVNLSGH